MDVLIHGITSRTDRFCAIKITDNNRISLETSLIKRNLRLIFLNIDLWVANQASPCLTIRVTCPGKKCSDVSALARLERILRRASSSVSSFPDTMI